MGGEAVSTDSQLEDETGTSFIFKACHSAALLPVIICSFSGSGTQIITPISHGHYTGWKALK